MKKIFLLLIPILILFSCKKREDTIRWNIDGIAPVVYGELSIYDILPDSVLVLGMDSSVSMNLDLNLFRLDRFFSCNSRHLITRHVCFTIPFSSYSITWPSICKSTGR